MTTQIFVSQINGTQANGAQATSGSIIALGSNGAYWANSTTFTATGYSGSAGFQGSAGGSGYQGSLGGVGFQGSIGFFGPTGFMGSVGAAGPGYQGSGGYRGSTGYNGSIGLIGSVGYQGSAGNLGLPGYLGSAGYQGSVGAGGPGYQGSIGTSGFQGSVGFMGSTGVAIGFSGSVGFGGSIGFQGSQGSTGFTGSAGNIAFTNLTDVPNTYSTHAGAYLRVNSSATGIIFDNTTYISNTFSSNVNCNNVTLFLPGIQSYAEIINNQGSVGSGGANISVYAGNIIKMTLTADVVGVVLNTTGLVSGKLYSYTFIISQDSTGSRTIDWSNQTVYWPTSESVPPTGPLLSTNAGYTDIINMYTIDGGSTWFGMLTAKGYAGI